MFFRKIERRVFFRMTLNVWGSNISELDDRYLNRRALMSRPRENPEKILKKFPPTQVSKNYVYFGYGDSGRKSKSPESPQSAARGFIGS